MPASEEIFTIASAGATKRRRRRFHSEERADLVHADHEFVVLDTRFLERSETQDPRIVDEHVELAEHRLGLRDGRLPIRLGRDVEMLIDR